jgi:Domain of unknown function (DUF4417)
LPIIQRDTEKQNSRNLRRERRRWDDADAHSLAMGCLGCLDRPTCGGLHKKQDHYNCLDDCCRNPATCVAICPRNQIAFVMRMREINGFDLNNIPRATPVPASGLPQYAPYIYHRNRRGRPLDMPVAAIPLHKMYSRRDGRARFASRAEISRAFGVAEDTKLILIGSGRDKPIEAWWGLSETRVAMVAALRALDVALISAPNYSVFSDQPRYDDMFNIKRIGIAWQEIVAGGVSCSLHINARTEFDYERIAKFIKERDEVTEISFEFGTGAAWPLRQSFHRQNLAHLADYVGRPLRLIMVGGMPSLPLLSVSFSEVTYIDTTAFMTALYRQRLVHDGAYKISKESEPTAPGAPVDDLLARNIALMQEHVETVISESRLSATTSCSAPMQESPESAPSDSDGTSSTPAEAPRS